VAGAGDELEEMQRRHAELDEAALDAFKRLFPRWVEADGICWECHSHLREIVQEPALAYY
jgi:hypothetical protein